MSTPTTPKPSPSPNDPRAPHQPGELEPARAPSPGLDDGKRHAPHQPSRPQLPETD